MESEIPRLNLPEGFIWGAATSAHQVEGKNTNDWSQYEQQNAQRLARRANADNDFGNGKGTLPNWEAISSEATSPANYVSGNGVGSWERWREDIDIARSLGLNALRFSIEWSRVQPEYNTVDIGALQRYQAMVEYCIDNKITPFVTLHHFTNPQWISKKGSWEHSEIVGLFDTYAQEVTRVLPQDKNIHYTVINEPNVYAGLGWIYGEWPPGKHNIFAYKKVKHNLAEAYKYSYESIKSVDESAQVGSAVNYVHFEPEVKKHAAVNVFLAKLARRLVNQWFHDETADRHDFIGINYYMHCNVNLGLFKNNPEEPRSDLGWYLHPDSLRDILHEAYDKYQKPVIVTEHGLADATDLQRSWYIKHSLLALQQAISEGVDARGYLHWSLLDNFEWSNGHWPKFGLVEVDRATMERTPRRSAYFYKAIIDATRQS